MQDFITPSLAPNLGGCQPFEFCPAHLVMLVPESVESVMEDEVLFIGDNRWYLGWHRETTASFSEKVRETDAGLVYDVSYKFFYPGMSAAVINLLQQLLQMKHVIKITDNNGLIRVAGEAGNGLKFRYEFSTGTDPSNLRGHQCEFFGTYKTRAPEYTWVAPLGGIGSMAIGSTFIIS